jgi:hypothetical protein
VNECREVYRLPIVERWFETDAFSNVSCLFVESVAQPVHNADHFDLAAGEESHPERNFTLDPCLLRLAGVACLRLGDQTGGVNAGSAVCAICTWAGPPTAGSKLVLATVPWLPGFPVPPTTPLAKPAEATAP